MCLYYTFVTGLPTFDGHARRWRHDGGTRRVVVTRRKPPRSSSSLVFLCVRWFGGTTCGRRPRHGYRACERKWARCGLLRLLKRRTTRGTNWRRRRRRRKSRSGGAIAPLRHSLDPCRHDVDEYYAAANQWGDDGQQRAQTHGCEDVQGVASH